MDHSPKTSVVPQPGLLRPRTVKKVPFVELFSGRLQGVISSGSDENRVYVAFVEAGSGDFNCSTNNNRPCGGLRGYPCSHLREMLHEAVVQYGLERVVQFLQPPGDIAQIQSEHDLLGRVGKMQNEFAGDIFSRFLSDLELLELPTLDTSLPAMNWFVD